MFTSDQENLMYNSPTPGEIPIVASSVFLNQDKERTKEEYISIFEELRNCSFNATYLRSYCTEEACPLTDLIFSVAALPTTKIKLILDHSWLGGEYNVINKNNTPLTATEISNLKNFISWNIYREMLGGWDFKDEPEIKQLANNSRFHQIYETILKYEEELGIDQKDYPLIYINLFGPGAPQVRDEYESYIQEYQDNFKPSFFSYDQYPITMQYGMSCCITEKISNHFTMC